MERMLILQEVMENYRKIYLWFLKADVVVFQVTFGAFVPGLGRTFGLAVSHSDFKVLDYVYLVPVLRQMWLLARQEVEGL